MQASNHYIAFLEISLLLAILLMGAFIFKKLKFDKITFIILIAALPVYGLFLYKNNWLTYAYDGLMGHISYITYIITNKALPAPDLMQLSYQPPLYYISSVIPYIISTLLPTRPHYLLILYSLSCHLIFLAFATKSLQILIKNKNLYYLAVVLLVFWPSGLITAARIDNSLLLNAFAAASIYYYLRWYKEKQILNLVIALVLIGFGILTKTNALLVLFSYLLITVYLLLTKEIKIQSFWAAKIIIAVLFILLSIGFNSGRIIYHNLTHDNSLPLVHGNKEGIMNAKSMRAENEPKHLFGFELKKYFTPPFHQSKIEATGKNFSWVAMLKTSLYGEFKFGNIIGAKLLNLSLLVLCAYIIFPLFFARKQFFKENFAVFVLLLVFIGGLFFNCNTGPVSSSSDFRCIYFSLIPILALFTANLYLLKAKGFNITYYSGCTLFFFIPALTFFVYFYYLYAPSIGIISYTLKNL